MSERELPEGWGNYRAEEIFESFGGGTPNKGTPSYWRGNIPWLSSGDIKATRILSASESITSAGLESSSAKICRAGSVLVVVRSGVLKHSLPVAVLDVDAAINQDIKCFDSGDDDLNGWLALALRAAENDILALNREGTTVQSVKYETLKNFEIALPPLPEQRRIVEKVEALLSEVNAARDRLAKVPRILKRFRQAVLAAACSGQLTADWRDTHAVAETANELLERLRPEREEQWRHRNPKRKYSSPEPVAAEELPPIPETWEWTNFDHCSWEITVGHVGPMRNRYVEQGVLFLRSQNVRPLRFDPAGLVFIDSTFHASLRKSALVGGEILVTRSGANTGNCCVFPEGHGEANCADLVVTRPLSGLVPAYGAIYVSSPEGQARIGLRETGIAQPHFNIKAMRVKAFPLPPVDEQREIVRRMEVLFVLADTIEQRVAVATTRAEKLPQAILGKAFRGELVPTEADLARAEGRDYETAAELLARVKAEREKTGETAKGRKAKTTGAKRGRPRKNDAAGAIKRRAGQVR